MIKNKPRVMGIVWELTNVLVLSFLISFWFALLYSLIRIGLYPLYRKLWK